MKAVIFDHDGTLVDSEGSHHKIWCTILHKWGIELSLQDYIARHAGVPTLQNAQLLVKQFKLDSKIRPHDLFQIKEKATQKFLTQSAFPLMPYVDEALTFCQQQALDMAIATGASMAEVDTTITTHKLHGLFDAIATRDQVQNNKPAPEVYLLAAKKLGVPPCQCIAVEDSNSGITAAKTAGLYCLAIPNEYSCNQDLSGADQVCENLKVATELIREKLSL